MATKPDVLVIGGGIIGLTSAYFLAKAGLSVEVIDKGDLGREASWAGAGIIPPGNPDRAATPIDRLRAVGSARFPELSAELRERTGVDNGYIRCGGIEFLVPEDRYAVDLWETEGIPFQVQDLDEVRRLEQAVVPPGGATAYRLPDCAQVRNPWHLRALIEACKKEEVKLTTSVQVNELYTMVDSSIGCAIAVPIEYFDARMFLVTTGAWGAQLLRPLACSLPIYPVRGQIVLFNPGRQLFRHVLMVGKRYLVPRDDGRVLAGSTEEPEAEFEKANTPEGVRGLTEFAHSLVPELRHAEVEATWAGLRPGSPDGMPFIGQVPGFNNLFAAVGHFRAGVQLSIGTAELVRDLITGKPPAVPADAFRLDRPPDLTARPAFRS